MQTKIWKIKNKVREDDSQIKAAAEILKQGETIAFPTETVYGLGANALNNAAVKKIFEAKGRPSDNPLIIHIATMKQLDSIIEEKNKLSELLIEKYWPGPLTLVFKKNSIVPDDVSAGLKTVAVRMPDNPIALSLIKAADIPIAAPSANSSGKPSPTKAEHVLEDLNNKIAGILDGGATGIGLESTVVDVTGEKAIVLRPGGITVEELEQVIGEIEVDSAIIKNSDKPKAPGMKYKHYAPKGEMLIVNGSEQRVIEKIDSIAKEKIKEGKKVGILTTNNHKSKFNQANYILAFGDKKNLEPMASNLYDALRMFDKNKIEFILVEGIDESGIGFTIMNRLKKAANGNIINI